MLARYSLSDEFNKEVIYLISTVSGSLFPFLFVALAIALVAHVMAIATFVAFNPMLILFWAAKTAVLFCGLLRCAYTDCTKAATNQVKVVSALQRKHKLVEYRARLTRNYL